MRLERVTYALIFMAVLNGGPTVPALAQTPFDPGLAEEASRIREELQVFTDRQVYAVDEVIYFAAVHRVSGPTGANPWSSVLYAELIGSNGESLVRGKYRLSGGRAEGSLHIPSESMTGNYFLKCYTRWMRNTGPVSFSYIPLKIINPFRTEVAGTGEPVADGAPVPRVSYSGDLLECRTGSDTYPFGQEAVLRLRLAPGGRADQLRCCVTVVPKGAVDLEKGQIENDAAGSGQDFRVNILPDLGNNITISGTVVGPDQEPEPYTTLHFSLLGQHPDYFAALSDVGGKFVISTPTGEGEYKEFFVTPEQENGSGLEVRIDQEYDSRPPGFPAETFRLSEDERELARKISLNMQLSKTYTSQDPASPEVPEVTNPEGDRIPFYGTHVNRLNIDDYVMLPNLEEVFINLIPEVQFYRKQGSKRIRILSENASIGVYKPLIMIDHISVFDHEALMALSPEKIERIDLINDIYLKGSVPFGGVLAIYSRKGDMAGIDLPQGSYFFDYQAFHPDGPGVDPLPVPEERIPDTRNTLLWSADLSLQEGQELEIPFRTPSSAGSYVVLVRAVTPEGKVIAASTEFMVK
jgi:hypothetical protein